MRSKRCPASIEGRRSGFTVLEALISVSVAGLALLVTMLLVTQMSDQLQAEQLRVTAIDNARVALDEITRTLRAAGSQADQARGQRRFLFADTHTIAMNANLEPFDDPEGTAAPMAVDPDLGGADIPLAAGESYAPEVWFGTGAETIVLTLDSDRDGFVTVTDAADDEEEESDNPNDYVLKRFAYGSDGGNNTMASMGLALLRGPGADADGWVPEPLFSYWIDDDLDATTDPRLHGDLDDDGALSPTEITLLVPVVPTDLDRIERIDVTVTAQTEKLHHGHGYRATVLRSSVGGRNSNTTSARVLGMVFNDVNANGVRDPGEVPLRDVLIRCSYGDRIKTDTEGRYSFILPPGVYTIQEADPHRYTSTTPNLVPVSPAPGEYIEVNFGDRYAAGNGFIRGLVFDDEDRDGVRDPKEPPLPDVVVFLDTGIRTTTDSLGTYLFTIATGNYTVTEEDDEGYASSTPNRVDINLMADGDSVQVDFGDYEMGAPGEIAGLVYLDSNANAVHDLGEPGIGGATVELDGALTTTTNSYGEFHFTASEGLHTVTETDPTGYTSSTVNTVVVNVVTGETVEVTFGDVEQTELGFETVILGPSKRALRITSLETGEDDQNDQDLLLGTHQVGATAPILVWWNARESSATPNSALFPYSADYARLVDSSVQAVAAIDLNGDQRDDLIAGLGTPVNNLSVWLTQGGSESGQLPPAPHAFYDALGALGVNAIATGRFDQDPYPDLAIGTTTGLNVGFLEIWHGQGGASFTRSPNDVYALALPSLFTIGDVISIAAADFTGDGVDDIALGTTTSSTESRVFLFVHDPSVVPGFDFSLQATFRVQGQIQDLLALDMKEDDQGDLDLVVASELSATTGTLELWHNRGDNHFGAGAVPDSLPSDSADPLGSPLSLASAFADNDVFPDIVVGTRSGLSFNGEVLVYRSFGFLPSHGTVVSASGGGEVVSIVVADFNKDGADDIATATRTSGATGRIVVHYNERHPL